ncbi:HEAT repeat-containing protein [Micromonospora pallida]|uniref:HEAT repeat-containing protein n=2 Tax=Micromonospora pallida TaxID=145854 RepID=A0A1C6RW98_9ACTN|nr:HEAT repeat-containing protein [Micromonospora pallida]
MVAYALGKLGNREATPALLRLPDDPDSHVRENARKALGSVGGPAAVDALLATNRPSRSYVAPAGVQPTSANRSRGRGGRSTNSPSISARSASGTSIS